MTLAELPESPAYARFLDRLDRMEPAAREDVWRGLFWRLVGFSRLTPDEVTGLLTRETAELERRLK